MMRVYCGRFDPQVGVTLIGYDEPTRSDEDLWAADLTSPTNSVIECLLLEQSPNRLQLAVSSPNSEPSCADFGAGRNRGVLPSGRFTECADRIAAHASEIDRSPFVHTVCTRRFASV